MGIIDVQNIEVVNYLHTKALLFYLLYTYYIRKTLWHLF